MHLERAFPLFPALIFVEIALYYLAPRLLAPLAFLTLGKPVRFRLAPNERDGLVELVDAETGYRERANERLALERIETEQFDGEDFRVWIRPGKRSIVARTLYTWPGNRGMGLMHTRLRVEGDEIVAVSRQLPLPLSVFVLFTLLGVAEGQPAFLLVLIVVFLVVVFFTRGPLLRARDQSLERLQEMIHAKRLTRARPSDEDSRS